MILQCGYGEPQPNEGKGNRVILLQMTRDGYLPGFFSALAGIACVEENDENAF